MPIQTLINAVKHWAERTFATRGEVEATAQAVVKANAPDWDAADGAPGHIANKPFGDKAFIFGELIFDEVVTTEQDGDSNIAFYPELSLGTYGWDIEVDGVVYRYDATTVNNIGGIYRGIGNASLLDASKPDTGEFFFFYTFGGTTRFQTVEPGTYTVKVGHGEEDVKRIDMDFMPVEVIDAIGELFVRVEAIESTPNAEGVSF